VWAGQKGDHEAGKIGPEVDTDDVTAACKPNIQLGTRYGQDIVDGRVVVLFATVRQLGCCEMLLDHPSVK